jgi:hypothetical protein
MAAGGMMMARGSRATGGTTMVTGDGWHDDGRHNNGKGQKEAAAPPPLAYQPQHHCENPYKSRQGLI